MKTWWLVAAAAVLVGWWWLRRGNAALAGTAKTIPAPAGATPAGTQAALEMAYKSPLQILLDATRQTPTPYKTLTPVGLGTVVATNLGTVGADKPLAAPKVQPPKECGSPGSPKWKACQQRGLV